MPVDRGNANRALDGGVSTGRPSGKRSWMTFSTDSYEQPMLLPQL